MFSRLKIFPQTGLKSLQKFFFYINIKIHYAMSENNRIKKFFIHTHKKIEYVYFHN